VFDQQGNIRAHGSKPELRGRNDWELRDANGHRHTKELIELGMSRGAGWVDYLWQNPRTGKVEPKSTYVGRCGDYILGCGIYVRDGAQIEGRAALRLPERAAVPALPKQS
jgi:cytochrome c